MLFHQRIERRLGVLLALLADIEPAPQQQPERLVGGAAESFAAATEVDFGGGAGRLGEVVLGRRQVDQGLLLTAGSRPLEPVKLAGRIAPQAREAGAQQRSRRSRLARLRLRKRRLRPPRPR